MSIIQVGHNYVFTKSGNQVKAIGPTTRHRNLPMWEVERVDGLSVGKRMDVPERALVTVEAWQTA